MGTAIIKHRMPHRVNFWHPATLMFRAERQSARMSKITWRLNPVWHRMLYSCTYMATVSVKGLTADNGQRTTSYTNMNGICRDVQHAANIDWSRVMTGRSPMSFIFWPVLRLSLPPNQVRMHRRLMRVIRSCCWCDAIIADYNNRNLLARSRCSRVLVCPSCFDVSCSEFI